MLQYLDESHSILPLNDGQRFSASSVRVHLCVLIRPSLQRQTSGFFVRAVRIDRGVQGAHFWDSGVGGRNLSDGRNITTDNRQTII